ncbi:MAG: hypothetical protein Q4G47_00260 [Lachnospiraceae bacterium]|nr:hypothetical protein [Lachnospiraceae bacterium]
MSKFLKLIVNLFLLGAILVAVAILVPPLAGIKTTIVDTTAMNTNLPLGSVTYSKDIDVFDVKAGDEILKENDASTYAYIIKETDAANGRFKAVSVADPNGPEEEIILRNTVPKVSVMIPFIGYVLIAMHSVEGIVIIILTVILVIILFILSELWKVRSDDEEEEEEEEREQTVREGGSAPRVTASEETDIDTDVVKAAFAESHSDLAEDTGAAGKVPSSENETAGENIPQSMEEGKGVLPDSGLDEDRRIEEALAEFGYPPIEKGAAPAGESKAPAEEVGALPENREDDDVKIYGGIPTAAEEEKPHTGSPEPEGSSLDAKEKSPLESGSALADLASRIGAGVRGTDDVETQIREGAEGSSQAEVPAEELPAENTAAEEGSSYDGGEVRNRSFIPTSRPTYDEILSQAKGAGRQVSVRKDDRSGVSVVDMSDML